MVFRESRFLWQRVSLKDSRKCLDMKPYTMGFTQLKEGDEKFGLGTCLRVYLGMSDSVDMTGGVESQLMNSSSLIGISRKT